MRRIVAGRHAHHAFGALFQRRSAQARARQETGVDHVAQLGLDVFTQGAGRIGAGKAMVDRDPRILRGDQNVFFERQFHGVDHALDR